MGILFFLPMIYCWVYGDSCLVLFYGDSYPWLVVEKPKQGLLMNLIAWCNGDEVSDTTILYTRVKVDGTVTLYWFT